MKILITGATGLIGKDLGKKLVAAGHEVSILTRNIEEAKSSLPFPAKILKWKNYSEPLPGTYFEDIDSVIHLAGESIAAGRWTTQAKKRILESRKIGTRRIVEAIKSSNGSVKQFISASAIGIYSPGDDLVHEASLPGRDFLSEVCQQWEEESQELSRFGVRVINPRIGIVLSRKGGAMDRMLPIFGLGLGGAIGSGKQWMSWIHQEDLTNMFLFFTQNPHLSGAFNAVAPNPVSNLEFSKCLADSLDRRLFLPVPKSIVKLALGEMSTLVTDGQRVSSNKIINEGFEFKYKDLRSALAEISGPLKNGHKEMFSEIWLPKKTTDVFPFFADERNLEKLTPASLKFHVLNKSTTTIQEGTIINYRLKIHGVPIRWKTLIESWEPGRKFVDRQLKGPYKLWHHTHEFEDFAGGTLMRDRVIYKVPLGRVGEMIAGPFVRSDVAKIFSYRKKIIAKLFIQDQEKQ